jgi:hypothetical protein
LRLKARRGAKKAVIAVGASILTIVYHMLRDGTCYQDLGSEYLARRNPAEIAAKGQSNLQPRLSCRNQRRRIKAVVQVSRESKAAGCNARNSGCNTSWY